MISQSLKSIIDVCTFRAPCILDTFCCYSNMMYAGTKLESTKNNPKKDGIEDCLGMVLIALENTSNTERLTRAVTIH